MFTLNVEPGLKLALLKRSDAKALLSQIDENRDYLRQWLAWLDDTRNVQVVENFIASTLQQFANQLGFQTGIYVNNGLVGVAGFKPIDPVNRIGEIGYWLSKHYQGRGIMSKCVRVLVKAGFEELALNKIEIRCAVENRRSRAVAQRLGFIEEAVLRQREWLYDCFVDHVVYSLLKSEYGALKT
ncbi:GNAT family N-acetyltransferase [Kaarinaea lacus]